MGVKRRMAVFQTRGAGSSGGGPVSYIRFSYLPVDLLSADIIVSQKQKKINKHGW